MATKKITDLQLISSIVDGVNFVVDNGIQTYRATASQIKSYVLAAGNVGTTALASDSVTTSKIADSNVTTSKIADSNVTRAKIEANERIPIGAVMAYAGPTAPSGFLMCDGSAVSRTTYSALFSIIGETHGEGDNSTTFNIPDYRGRFLRGVDGGTGRDPNAGTRTAMGTNGNTGDNVGSLQNDAFQGHYHTHKTSGSESATAGSGLTHNNDDTAGSTTISVFEPIADGTNGTPRTSSETRPKNANVFYIIKY